MAAYRSPHQPDLFATPRSTEQSNYAAMLREPPPADFTQRIRDELNRTLAKARDAAVMPWRDLTAATLAELRFNSITNWLPPAEGTVLRESFAREMVRLWAIVEREAVEAS
jgi:hypothetical protein